MASESRVEALLERNNELLETLLKLQLKSVLDEELADPIDKKLYELTGEKPVNQIATELKMSVGKISGIWKRWEQRGLLLKAGRSYKRVF